MQFQQLLCRRKAPYLATFPLQGRDGNSGVSAPCIPALCNITQQLQHHWEQAARAEWFEQGKLALYPDLFAWVTKFNDTNNSFLGLLICVSSDRINCMECLLCPKS